VRSYTEVHSERRNVFETCITYYIDSNLVFVADLFIIKIGVCIYNPFIHFMSIDLKIKFPT